MRTRNGMYVLDCIDIKLLYELRRNSRQTNTDIGRILGMTRQAVNQRLRAMENAGIIKCYTVHLDGSNIMRPLEKGVNLNKVLDAQEEQA